MEFCPICYKETEKEIWKKDSRFKEDRWLFCPNHGYVKDSKQSTELKLRIQSAKRRRLLALSHAKAASGKNAHVFLLNRGLFISFLCMIVLLCAVLGYFVGMSTAIPHDSAPHHLPSFGKAAHKEYMRDGSLQ